MYCKFCGSNIDDDSVFCRVCGKQTNGAPAAEQAAPASTDGLINSETAAHEIRREQILTRLNENVREVNDTARGEKTIGRTEPFYASASDNMREESLAAAETNEEFIDVFSYWAEMPSLKKIALLFVFGAAAMWAAMLVLTVFFLN